MLNFSQFVPLAAKAAGDKPVLAAPYPLPMVVCRELVRQGVIGGFVAQSNLNPTSPDPMVAGWWMDRRFGGWFLRRGCSRSIILLSVESEDAVSSAMLLEARLKGYERILLVGQDGSIMRQIDIGSALSTRLGSAAIFPSYADAFEEMYTLLGDRFRLADRAFDPERVLIYIGDLGPGGAERQATYTACGLARCWPGKVHVACTFSGARADFYKPALDAAGVSTLILCEDEEFSSPGIMQIRNELTARYSSLGFLNIFHLIFHQALLIQTIRPGLVHTFLDINNITVGAAAHIVGVPRLVLSGRSVAPDHFSIHQPYMHPGYRALLKRRKVVFLNNSNAGATDYARWLGLPKDDFRVIHNGFEFPEPQPTARTAQRHALGIPDNALLIGSIIGFREEKRPQLFLEMARLVQIAYPHTRFVIFGDGALLAACRNFVQSQNLTGIVHLPGLTSNAWHALAAMDVFVLTSRLEGLPNVLIEAQAMGLPVISSAAGGMPETFINGETGLIANPGTPEGFAAAVRQLIDDRSLAAKMGKRAAEHARATFGLQRMTELTVEAYAAAPVKTHDVIPDWTRVDSAAEIRLGGAVKDAHYGFVADLPIGENLADWRLWEDDHPLGPPSEYPGTTSSDGKGRYAILPNKIVFSSSDGSDVRFNGRIHRLRPAGAEPDFDEFVINPERVSKEIGHCYIAQLGLTEGSARVGLWENETRLGPGGCVHDEIRTHGAGCYSLWGSNLYFSTADNSDPRTNGRTYVLRRGRKAPALKDQGVMWAGAPIERALRHMLVNSAPRGDYVPSRIVHVIGSLGPGGAERQMLYTLSHLACQPFESVQVLCYYRARTGNDRHDFFVPAFAAAGIPVRTIRQQAGDDDPASMPASLREIRRALPQGLASDIADLFWEFMSLRPEIVHAWLDGNNIRAGLAAALAGVPRIIVSGRNVNPSHFDYLYEPGMRPAYRALLELPHVTMVNNSYAGRNDYADWLGIVPERIPVIHNGCEFPANIEEEKRWQVRRAYGIPADAIVVTTVTRLSEEKNPLLFIEMARCVIDVQPDLKFLFFGIGSMEKDVHSLIERFDLAASVRLMGVTDSIWSTLAATDVFVLTSRMEGLPNVLIEAQCAGVPVISTKVGGAPETFIEGKTGLGVDDPDPEILAQTVLRLTSDPDLRAEMSAAAAAYARKNFSIAQMIQRTLNLYRAQVPPTGESYCLDALRREKSTSATPR